MSVLFLPPPSASSIPDASETVSGKIRIATSAEATAGTNDLTAMTPAKVKTVVDAAVVGGVQYKGTFDASAPADLSNAEQGDLYIISVAGTYQGQSWAVGDHLLINADMGGTVSPSKIDKVDNTDSVTSVAGRTGAVTLSTADISGLATVASTGAYSDLSGTPTLGTAAALDVGTSATNVVQLNGSAQLPAVDGSLLTNLPSDVSSISSNFSITVPTPSSPEFVAVRLQAVGTGQTVTLPTAGTGVNGTTVLVANDNANYAITVQPASGNIYLRNISSASVTLEPNQVATFTAISGIWFVTDLNYLNLDVSSPANGEALVYNGTSGLWENSTVSASVAALNDIGDVSAATPSNTNVIKYNSTSGDWESGAVAYSDLSGTPTLGTAAALNVGTSATNVVQLDGSARLPAVDGSQLTGITASVAALDDIGDVAITSVQDYAVLKYDSTSGDWIDASLINAVYTSTTQSLDLKPGVNRVTMAGASSITLTLGVPTLVASQGAVFSVLSTGSATNTLTIGSTSWSFDQHQGGVFVATGLNTAYMVSTIDYNQLENLPTLGTAAALDVGTSASNVVQLNGSAQLPAVDGSQLTGITASVAALNDIGDVSAATPSNTNVIKYNSTSGDWESGAVAYAEVTGTPTLATVATTGAYSDLTGTPTLATVATTGAYSDLTGTPTLATVATTGAYSDLSGTPTLGTAAALDVGTSANNVVQLNGSAQLPAVDGSLLTGVIASVGNLNDIGDVSAASPSAGDRLVYDGSNWVPVARFEVVTVTTSTTLTVPEEEQLVLFTGSGITATLPSISSNSISAGIRYQLKVTDSNYLTVAPSGSETIDGTTSYTTAGAKESLTVVCDGTNWRLI